MPSPRRFPPPWTIEELNDACFVVSDSAAQKLAYVYFEDELAQPCWRWSNPLCLAPSD
jgi:hypothetical protein